jgi:hypothetical protein
VEVRGITTVVETQLAIRFTTAATEVPGYGIPAATVEGANHTQYIGSFRTAFQSVAHNRHTGCPYPRVIQVEEVIVGGCDPLPLIVYVVNAAEQSRHDGLYMAVAKKPGRLVSGRSHNRHDIIPSGTRIDSSHFNIDLVMFRVINPWAGGALI